MCGALLFVFSPLSSAKQITGHVIKVSDGDTIKIETRDREIHTIRLLGIDAPEKEQKYGMMARDFLAEYVLFEKVTIKYDKKDFFRRVLGKIIFEGQDINQLAIQNGYAWFYKKFRSSQPEKDRTTYEKAEIAAKNQKLGLWSQSSPMAPWDWRKAQKER